MSLPEKDSAAPGSSSLSWSIGVQIPSGQMHDTSMFLIPASRRSATVLREKPIAACFEAAYTASPGTGASPASETMLTTWPPCARIAVIALTVPLIVPSALTSTSRRRDCASCSHAGPVTRTPALLTQTSSRPARWTSRRGPPPPPPRRVRRAHGAGTRPELGGHGRGGLAVEVGHQDVVTAVDEEAGDESPQTATGSGDDGSTAGAHAVRLGTLINSPRATASVWGVTDYQRIFVVGAQASADEVARLR